VDAGVEIKNKSTQRENVRKQVRSPIPVLFGFDQLETLKWMKAHSEPFLFIDHAYFDRGYERGNFRAIYNTIHQTNEYDLPDDRRKRFGVKLKDWQEWPDGRIVFIPSPANPSVYHKEPKWNDDAIDLLVKKTVREIYVKSQKTKGLGDSIHKAWALVSHCSVAAVEAACHGIPVVTSRHNPAAPISVDLEHIESPIRPNRDKWVNTLTYSQFTLQELSDGSAWQIIKEMNRL
jgi:hypothetical protein